MLIRERKLNIKKPCTISAAQKTAWYIFAASIIYLLVVLIIAPYKVLRYIMPVCPFLVIMPATLINTIGTRSRKIAACAMLLLCGSFAFNAAQESKIENLFRGKQNEYVFTQDKDTPVYVANFRWSAWKNANLTPYLHDEQTYYFVNIPYEPPFDINLPEAEDYDSVYMVVEYIPEFSQLYDVIISSLQITGLPVQGAMESEFEINTGESETWHPYFKGGKIILKE